MYKVPEMTQKEAFSLFIAWSRTQDPRADWLPCGRESGLDDGYGGESRYMAEPRRGTKSEGTKQTKSRRVRTVGIGTKSKKKQKAVVGEEGFWERSPGKRDCDY